MLTCFKCLWKCFENCKILYGGGLVVRSCLILVTPPMDFSPPDSSVYEISRQEYRSGLQFPSPGDLPDPGIKSRLPALQVDSLLTESPGKSPGKKLYRNMILFRISFIWWLFSDKPYLFLKVKICLQGRWPVFNSWVGKIPWGREWLHTPVFLPTEFHGQESLACYNP